MESIQKILIHLTTILAMISIFSKNVRATDVTNDMVQNVIISGAQIIGTFSGNTIYLDQRAKHIIEQKKFDINDDSFNLEAFSKYIIDVATWEYEILKFIDSKNLITNSHLVITDFDANRSKTICSTVKNSRYMECDIRRLHKFFKGQYEYRLYFSIFHEWTHQLQYAENSYKELPLNSTPEGKILSHDRELKAVLFEPYVLSKKYGFDDGVFKYASMMAGLKCKFQEYDKSIGEQYEMTQIGRRCISLAIPLLINTKVIASIGLDREQLMYEIAIGSLKNDNQGVEALVSTLNNLNLKIKHEIISYEKLIEEIKNLYITDNE